MQKLELTNDLIGKYLNQYLWSDINPIGKIVGIKGKTKVLVQPIVASENKVKMEYVAGGFSAHCVNQSEQEYDYFEQGEVYEMTLSKTKMKRSYLGISNKPYKYYDFNF